MTKIGDSFKGCLVGICGLLALCIGPYAIAALTIVFATPGLVPYLYLNVPAEFEPYRKLWLAALGAAPLLALLFVRWVSPSDGRLRASRKGPDGTKATLRGKAARAGLPWILTLRARRPPLLLGYLSRITLLLTATGATSAVMLSRGYDVHGPHAGQEMVRHGGAVWGAVLVVLIAVRRWDRRYVEPITVEAVRAEVRKAERALRRVRADNERLSRLVRQVEVKLAAAGSQKDFATLRNLHSESFGCADGVYGHYRSVQDSLHMMTRTVRQVRYASRQPLNLIYRQARADLAELRAAAASLAEAQALLDADTQRQLDLVRHLNGRTADLKHTIRDECGQKGLGWYKALEERIAAAREGEREWSSSGA